MNFVNGDIVSYKGEEYGFCGDFHGFADIQNEETFEQVKVSYSEIEFVRHEAE